MSNDSFQPISCGVVLLVFGLMSLDPGTQSLDHGLKHLSLDNDNETSVWFSRFDTMSDCEQTDEKTDTGEA